MSSSTPELADTLTASEGDRLLQAEALVRSYCRWHIAPAHTEDITLEPSGTNVLILPTLRLTAVSSITEDGVTLDPNQDYRWNSAGVITRRWRRWCHGPVVASVTHGYADVPAEVRAVVQAVAQRALDNPGSRVRTQVGQVSETYTATGFNQSVPLALIDAEKDILSRYRLPALP